MGYIECDTPSISVQTIVLPLVELAKQRGVNTNKLLKGSRLFYDDLQNPLKKISFQQLDVVFTNSYKLLNKDGVSFILAQHWLFNQTSPAHQALINAKTMSSMCRVLTTRQSQIWPYTYFSNYPCEKKHNFIFNFAISEPSGYSKQFFYEFILSLICQLCKWRFGSTEGISVKLPYEQPKHIEQYHAHLNLNYEFEQPYFMISIPKNVYIQKQSLALSGLYGFYFNQSKLEKKEIGFLQYISTLLKRNSKLSLVDIASSLEISTATLKRKLKLHNSSIQLLKDNIQKQHAIVSISEIGSSNEEVAKRLNYNDLTNFRRSVKRWTGMTPSELRKFFS